MVGVTLVSTDEIQSLIHETREKDRLQDKLVHFSQTNFEFDKMKS